MTDYVVSSGQTSSGITLLSGDREIVLGSGTRGQAAPTSTQT